MADLRAWVEVERLSGACLLPVDAVVLLSDGQKRPPQPVQKQKRERVPPQRLSER